MFNEHDIRQKMYEVLRDASSSPIEIDSVTLPAVIMQDDSPHAGGKKCGEDGCPCASDPTFS